MVYFCWVSSLTDEKKNFFSFYFILCVADIKKKKKLILCFFKWFMQKNGIKGEASIACARQTDRRWKTLDEKKKCVSIVVRWFIVLNSKYYIGEYVYTPFFLYYYSHHHHRPRVLFLFHEKFNRSCWSFSPPSVDIFSSFEMFQPKVRGQMLKILIRLRPAPTATSRERIYFIAESAVLFKYSFMT